MYKIALQNAVLWYNDSIKTKCQCANQVIN